MALADLLCFNLMDLGIVRIEVDEIVVEVAALVLGEIEALSVVSAADEFASRLKQGLLLERLPYGPVLDPGQFWRSRRLLSHKFRQGATDALQIDGDGRSDRLERRILRVGDGVTELRLDHLGVDFFANLTGRFIQISEVRHDQAVLEEGLGSHVVHRGLIQRTELNPVEFPNRLQLANVLVSLPVEEVLQVILCCVIVVV